MIKKIAAAVLSVAVTALLFVLFFPRGTDNAPAADTSEGFTVGVGKLSGNVSPFFEEEAGDREVHDPERRCLAPLRHFTGDGLRHGRD